MFKLNAFMQRIYANPFKQYFNLTFIKLRLHNFLIINVDQVIRQGSCMQQMYSACRKCVEII